MTLKFKHGNIKRNRTDNKKGVIVSNHHTEENKNIKIINNMKNNKLHSLVQNPWVFYPFPIIEKIVIKNPFQHIQGVLAKVN